MHVLSSISSACACVIRRTPSEVKQHIADSALEYLESGCAGGVERHLTVPPVGREDVRRHSPGPDSRRRRPQHRHLGPRPVRRRHAFVHRLGRQQRHQRLHVRTCFSTLTRTALQHRGIARLRARVRVAAALAQDCWRPKLLQTEACKDHNQSTSATDCTS